MNLTQATMAFLDHCQLRKLSPHTIRAYRLDLKGFLGFAGGDRETTLCDKVMFHAYVKHLFDIRRLRETSVRRHVATLRSFFRWVTEEVGALNPFLGTRIRIQLPRRLPKVIPRADIRRLLSNVDMPGARTAHDLTASVAAELLFATGMRVGELATLKDCDVEIEEGVIRIVGKGNRERRVFVPDNDLKAILRSYRADRDKLHTSADTFLISAWGRSASTQYIRRLIRELGERSGLARRVTPHMFRHSIATLLLEEGVDIRYVQRLLGHNTITTTEIYTHVADAALRLRINDCHPRRSILEQGDN